MNVKKYYNIKHANGNYINSIKVFNKHILLNSSSNQKDALIYTEEECEELLERYKKMKCYSVLTAKRINSLHIRISYENE